MVPHLLLLQTTPWDLVGHWAVDINLQSCSQAQSITPACSQQSGSADSAASHHSIHSHATKDGEELSSESDSSQEQEDGTEEEDNTKEGKGRIKTSSDGQEVSDGEDRQEHPHTQDTLTSVSQLFGEHKDTDPESDPREKVQSAQQKQCQDSPKEDSLKKDSSRSSSSKEEPPTDEALHDGARQKVWLLDTCFDAWHHNKIANSVTGWAMQDTMICDLPKHSKMQPNHPNPMGLPLDYMAKCRVFNGIWSNLYDLCHFFILGMTGNLPEFPMPWEPVTHSQVRDLLKSAQSIGRPYMVLVHSHHHHQHDGIFLCSSPMSASASGNPCTENLRVPSRGRYSPCSSGEYISPESSHLSESITGAQQL